MTLKEAYATLIDAGVHGCVHVQERHGTFNTNDTKQVPQTVFHIAVYLKGPGTQFDTSKDFHINHTNLSLATAKVIEWYFALPTTPKESDAYEGMAEYYRKGLGMEPGKGISGLLDDIRNADLHPASATTAEIVAVAQAIDESGVEDEDLEDEAERWEREARFVEELHGRWDAEDEVRSDAKYGRDA